MKEAIPMKQQPNPTDAEQTDALVDMIEQLMEGVLRL